jgi:hypothetical protein
MVVDEICNNLFEYNRGVYTEDEFDSGKSHLSPSTFG